MSTGNNLEEIYSNSIKILKDLIAFKTVSGENNTQLIDYCDNILNSLGAVSFRTYDEEEKRVNLFSTIKAKEESKKKSHFEIIFSTIVKVNENIKDKKELEKIILCDVQNEIYPDLEKSLLNLLHNSGYPEIKFEKVKNLNGFAKKTALAFVQKLPQIIILFLST